MKGAILSMYRNVLACRGSTTKNEQKNSRSSYSFHPGVFTFLYIALNKQEKERKKEKEKRNIPLPPVITKGFILDPL
jgi:hypothetical protein